MASIGEDNYHVVKKRASFCSRSVCLFVLSRASKNLGLPPKKKWERNSGPDPLLTGPWELPLEPPQTTSSSTRSAVTHPETINVIFDLHSARQSLLWYHAAAGFPTKETFGDAVCAGSYSTWPGLTTKMIHCHFLDSN